MAAFMRARAAAATVAARGKADELSDRFSEWLWEDERRTAELTRTYNEKFNSLVLRTYDNVRPQLPGLAEWFKPFPHQYAAVARIVNEPAALLAHEVGAGKTAEMAMGCMELRRLGLASKPAIVVPNHMLKQFQVEFLQLYPQARVLACGTKDLQKNRRHTFIARIATGDWDAVIMSRSVFERIPMSAAEQERYIKAKLVAYDRWLERAAIESEDTRMVKRMEKQRLSFEERLKRKLSRARDAGLSWEQTGVDYLFVDEAHGYKNLDTRSNSPALDIDGSGRAADLEMKLDYLRRENGQRIVTFATATPIANSMTEAYVMLSYLRPDLLKDAGIDDFDGWAGSFTSTVSDVEVAPEGGLRVKERVARFRNLPELLLMWRVVADVKTAEDPDYRTPAERAAADRSWTFGHVIVDEAQELSEMDWRLLMRRCPARSMTVVGDTAQTSDLAGTTSWGRVLDPYAAGRWRLSELTINYRMPAEIMAVAARVLAEIDPSLKAPNSVRATGTEVRRLHVPPGELGKSLAQIAAREATGLGDRRLAVIVPPALLDELGSAVTAAVPSAAIGENPELAAQVVILTAGQAKGLEFDSVLVAEPAQIIAGAPRGLNDLYVALTRATQRLGIVHSGELPGALRPDGECPA